MYNYKTITFRKKTFHGCLRDHNMQVLGYPNVKFKEAINTFKNQVEKGLSLGKRVVVAGCVPQAAPKAKYLRGLSLVGVQQIDRIVEVVEETLKGNTVRLFGTKKIEGGGKAGGASLALPKVRRNPLIEIISISTGCLNQCTYCKTKHARGELGSYPPEEIAARLRQSTLEGCVEIWLTSEDTGAYGKDIGSSLPDLLELLARELESLPGNMRLRLGMTNPPYILEHLPRVAKILNHPKVYKFLHVPVQSGSDSVLGDMKREYNVEDFSYLVDYLLEHVSGITIATDIIAGFPTETEDDWQGTMALCEKYKFKSLFINQFYPRPGTPAAKMSQLPATLIKQRTKQLTELFHSYQPYSDRVGEIYNVLVTETSSDGRFYVGHNQFYEQILIPLEPKYLGTHVTVKVTEVSKWSMKGEVVSEPIPAGVPIQDNAPLLTKTNNVLGNGVPVMLDSTFSSSNLTAPSYAIFAILFAIILRIVWFLL